MKIKQSITSLSLVGSMRDSRVYLKTIRDYYGGSMLLKDLLQRHTLTVGVHGKPIYDDNCEIGEI